MTIKVEFIEMIWDNYQGASGKPITRSVLIDLDGNMILDDVQDEIVARINQTGIADNFVKREFYSKSVLSVEILPKLK